MVVWGIILFSIGVGRLLANIFGPGNVWGNISMMVIAVIIISIGFIREERKREQETSRQYQNPKRPWL
jgi:protein-S-isoprenylcysteine O-methyltransferase Ste14